MPPTVTNPPDGWSVDKDELKADLYWGQSGEGAQAAKTVGLTDAQPLMIKSRDAGGDAYVFTASGGKVYLWNMAMEEVWEYVKPADLEGILAEMRKTDSDVEMKKMQAV